jgi:hypothetical protein
MMQFSVPAGRCGIAMQRCVEEAVNEMSLDIEAHRGGTRMYPEDVEGCNQYVKSLWDEIKSLRDLASFSLSNVTQLGLDYTLTKEDPLMVVTRNAVLLEFVDQELGENAKSSIGSVMRYIMFNPNFPDDGTRIYH